jgi:hypothetical protein
VRLQLVDDYRAGACNIGPAEIARRRMTGHLGAAATLALLGVLLLVGAPPWWRLALAAPAALSASGYLQAATRFCAAYGWRGVFNFGSGGFGSVSSVPDAAARRADRVKAATIGAGSALIGGLVGLGAFLLG